MVSSLEQICRVIIPHFDNYPLITQKKSDYLLFKQAVQVIKRKEHLTASGLQTIVNIRASLSPPWLGVAGQGGRGLLEALKKAFPDTVPVKRPLVDNQVIPHSQ